MTPGPGSAGIVEVVVDRMLACREMEERARGVVNLWNRGDGVVEIHATERGRQHLAALEDALLTLDRNPPPGRA
ncbi:MAG: hypothetical protein LC798_13665 [Chloroflexi bacterium]|nr:hypothetical protein [Chloroflexota bacterium]